MIKLIAHEDDRKFSPALVQCGDLKIDAKFHKDPETGVINVCVEEPDDFPYDEVVKLTVNDEHNSYYNGVFAPETGVFTPL